MLGTDAGVALVWLDAAWPEAAFSEAEPEPLLERADAFASVVELFVVAPVAPVAVVPAPVAPVWPAGAADTSALFDACTVDPQPVTTVAAATVATI